VELPFHHLCHAAYRHVIGTPHKLGIDSSLAGQQPLSIAMADGDWRRPTARGGEGAADAGASARRGRTLSSGGRPGHRTGAREGGEPTRSSGSGRERTSEHPGGRRSDNRGGRRSGGDGRDDYSGAGGSKEWRLYSADPRRDPQQSAADRWKAIARHVLSTRDAQLLQQLLRELNALQYPVGSVDVLVRMVPPVLGVDYMTALTTASPQPRALRFLCNVPALPFVPELAVILTGAADARM